MKYFRITILFFSLLIFTACPKIDSKNLINIDNNSDRNITVYVGVIGRENGGSLYPDTLLPPLKVGMDFSKKTKKTYIYNYSYSKNIIDTLCFFIWDTDTANILSWDSIRLKNKILQRYDLSLRNIEKLKWTIAYPPTELMKDMKMYPPYKEE